MGVRFSTGKATVALYNTSLSSIGLPIMLHCKVAPAATPSGDQWIMGLVDSISGHYVGIVQNGLSVKAVHKGFFTRTATATTTLAGNRWNSVTAIFVSTTSRSIYSTDDAENLSTGTNTGNTSTFNNMTWGCIGARLTAATPTFTDKFAGSIADACFWSTTGSLAVIHNQMHHRESRVILPDDYLHHFPLFGTATDYKNDQIQDASWTASGSPSNPTITPRHPPMGFNRRHPRIYIPPVVPTDHHELILQGFM